MTPAAEKAFQVVLEKFQTGELSALVKVATYKIPASWPSAKWSLGNKMLAYMQARTLNIRGYRQWQDAKRQVKKGAHSIYIWSPRMISKEEEGEKKSILTGFLPIAVFPIEQTEGEPLPDDWTPRQLPPLADVAAKLGVTVSYQPTAPDRLGDCGHGKIILGTDDPRVFWHELAHAAHAATDPAYKDRSPEYKEVVAEFTACALAAVYGQDYTGNAWQYIQHFAKDPIQAVMKASHHIEQILTLILPDDTPIQ